MFSKIEIRDLVISIVVLALIFSGFVLENFLEYLFIIIAVFASHEIIGHKIVAQKYGCSAEYRMWPMGLLLGVITGFLGGIIFAAPGAVYISPIVRKGFAFRVAHLTKKEYGIISLAGPAVNIAIGIILLITNLFYPLGLLTITAKISFFLAFFNLIPILPLDGGKIFRWNKYIWFIAIVLAFIGFI
ncbi:MAG: site-2 protease family protein [Candidatus Aenigmatarchaeota archaeon]